MVAYTGNGPFALRYVCHRSRLDNGEQPCISFSGLALDEAISKDILGVVQPAAIDAAVLASEEESRQRDEILLVLQRDLEAAQYAAQRAQRQYDMADTENRLVAKELEHRWNQTLQNVTEVELRIQQLQQQVFEPATREEFHNLATELEAVWNCSGTDARLKRRIVRTLIEEVVVDVDEQAREIIAVAHWKGGVHTEFRIPRRSRGHSTAHTAKEVVEAVRVLARVCSDDMIAGALTRNGFVTGMGNRWTRERVISLRSHHRIACYNQEQRKAEGWMTLTEAAAGLGVSGITLRLAIERGEIAAEHPLPDGPRVLNRCVLDSPAAAQLVDRVRRNPREPALPVVEQGCLDLSGT